MSCGYSVALSLPGQTARVVPCTYKPGHKGKCQGMARLGSFEGDVNVKLIWQAIRCTCLPAGPGHDHSDDCPMSKVR